MKHIGPTGNLSGRGRAHDNGITVDRNVVSEEVFGRRTRRYEARGFYPRFSCTFKNICLPRSAAHRVEMRRPHDETVTVDVDRRSEVVVEPDLRPEDLDLLDPCEANPLEHVGGAGLRAIAAGAENDVVAGDRNAGAEVVRTI